MIHCRKRSWHLDYGQGILCTDRNGETYYRFYTCPHAGPRQLRAALPPADGAKRATGQDADREEHNRRHLARQLERFRGNLTPALATRLVVNELGLPGWAVEHLSRFGVGYRHDVHHADGRVEPGGWTAPERNGAGETCGATVRLDVEPGPDGEPRGGKRFLQGSHRGLTHAADLADDQAVAFVPEGLSDVLAMAAAGLVAVGRPNDRGGAADLAALAARFPGLTLVILAENDRKPDGRWPGLTGALYVAREVSGLTGRPALVAIVPDGAKDPRGWLNTRAGPDATPAEFEALGRELAEKLLAGAFRVGPQIPAEDEPGFDDRRRCSRPLFTQLRGKEGTRQAGRAAAACFGCGGWACTACNPRKAAAIYRRAWECIRTAADADFPDGPENPDRRRGLDDITRKPVPPGESRMVPRSLLYVATAGADDWRNLTRSVRRAGGEYVRVMCRTDQAVCAAIGRDKHSPEPPQETNATSPGKGAPAAQLATVIIAALPPDVRPPPGFTPIGIADAIRLAGVALLNVPTWPPSDTVKRYRPVELSRGWKAARRKSEWKRTGPSAFPPDEVAGLAAAAGFAVRRGGLVSENTEGTAATWSGPRPLLFVFSELIAPAEDGRCRDGREVLRAYRRWLAAIPADQPAGPCLEREVRARLWDGPWPSFVERLPLLAAADRELLAMEAVERAAEAEKPEADRAGRIERTNRILLDATGCVPTSVGPRCAEVVT